MITLTYHGLCAIILFACVFGGAVWDRFNAWRKESEKRAIWRRQQKEQPKAIRMDKYKKTS